MDTFHIAWYATGFRGERTAAALRDVTATSMRYGATEWSLHRSLDDRYKFLQIVHFADKLDFERWWAGREMIDFRVIASSWYQVPLLYVPHELVGEGHVDIEAAGAGNGAAATAGPAPAA
ncbi:MAG TPA: hypothetical protein VMT10_04700 [Solirubrobacteraceae bacterium]|nr:hypothetical protein [Solirubrobacteraceae bacterium]